MHHFDVRSKIGLLMEGLPAQFALKLRLNAAFVPQMAVQVDFPLVAFAAFDANELVT